jgi:hypothetical protein
MDTETLNAIKNLFEEYANKDTGTVTAAYLTVFGMFGVAFLSAITQWLITKRILKEEYKRLSLQLNSEFNVQRHHKWESDLLDSLVQLLKVTDPDLSGGLNSSIIAEKVIRVQLLLDNTKPLQGQVNNLVNHLALTASGWHGEIDKQQLLTLHAQVQDLAKKLIYHPDH